MYRQILAQDHGMLFDFGQEGVYPFWMKNTLIPLDIVWLDKNLKIVFISADTLPCKNDPCVSVNPGAVARYVLEVNAGEMARIGARPGDAITINH
jgi:hypothetical protein